MASEHAAGTGGDGAGPGAGASPAHLDGAAPDEPRPGARCGTFWTLVVIDAQKGPVVLGLRNQAQVREDGAAYVPLGGEPVELDAAKATPQKSWKLCGKL